MGLSDEERISGMFYAVKALTKLGKELRDNRSAPNQDYNEMCQLIKRLWPAAVGSQSNSAHWILGSSAGNVVAWKTSSVWGVMVKEHIETAARQLGQDPDLFAEADREFDPFDCFLSISGLLPDPQKKVFNIFGWTEQLVYYLRRYKDEFFKDFSELSDIIAWIQGECFAMFSEEIYTKAYLVNRIAEAVYRKYQDKDVIRTWLSEQNMYHNISRPVSGSYQQQTTMKDLVKMHLKIVKAKNHYKKKETKKRKRVYDLERVLVTLELAGRRYHYEHQHKKLLVMLKEDGWKEKALKRVQESIEKCKVAHLEYDKDQKEQYDTSDDEIFYKWMV